MSVEEYFQGYLSFSELKPEERLEALFRFIRAIGREGTTREALERRFPSLSSSQIYERVYRDLYFGNLVDIVRGRITLTPRGLRVLERGRLTLRDFREAEAPEWLIKRLTRKPRVLQAFIGTDDVTGGRIYWHRVLKKYRLVVKGKKPKYFEKLGIVVHGSIDTGGKRAHERLLVEAKTWTFVNKFEPGRIEDVEDELREFLDTALTERFGTAAGVLIIKEGASYLSEPHGECYMIDYPEKGFFAEYRHYDKKTGKLKRSNAITFLESEL